MNDERIIELFFERSEQAIKELDKKYGRVCYTVSYNILNNRQDAEECVNDAYLGTWNAIPPAKPNFLLAFVCKIVRNISLKRYEQNTATYDLSLYYEYLKTPGNVAADAPGSISLFRAEDFSEEIMKKRMYVFDYGHCKVEIGILCGEYVVEYCYAGEEISPQAFYEIIISSRHFDTMG